MRIGFDAKRLYSNLSGLGNYSRTLLRNLAEFYPDNQYFLYTPGVKSSPESDVFLHNPAYHTHISTALWKSFWRSYSMLLQLKKDGIQLYHGLSNELPVRIDTSNIRSVVTIHDLIFRRYPYTYSAIDRKIYHAKIKNSCPSADRIVAISNSTKQDLIEFYDVIPEKIDVVYQSCSPIYYQQQTSQDIEAALRQYLIPAEYFLYVGTVERRKNLELLIKAYQRLQLDFRIPLVVVGRGKKYKNEIVRQVASAGLTNRVLWIDNLKNDNHLHAIYQGAMALIYPSLYEGFGLPVVEALLSKTPVITSNVSSLPEAGGPHSLYIDPNDAEELAHTMQKLLNDGELRDKMTREGYAYAISNFGSQVVTERMMEVYKNTLRQI